MHIEMIDDIVTVVWTCGCGRELLCHMGGLEHFLEETKDWPTMTYDDFTGEEVGFECDNPECMECTDGAPDQELLDQIKAGGPFPVRS